MADLPPEVNAAIDAEIAELEGRMSNVREWHQPSNQPARDRIQQLYEQQDSGTAPSPAPAPRAERMAVIEQAMAEASGEYWKSPDMQNEYLAILEAEDAPEPGPSLVGREDLADMPADVIGVELMREMGITDAEADAWGEWMGVEPSDVSVGLANARALWDGLASLAGDGVADLHADYLQQVPSEAMRNIDRECCLDAPAYTSASAGDVTRFNQTSAGALASQLWGDRAPDYLGLMMSRWSRMTDDLSDEDFTALDTFVRNRLAPRERAFLWQSLAT